MGDLLTIGEFSKASGLSPKRLRSYAADGLLVPAAVDAGTGYRYYSPSQLGDAELIDALRRAGVPLVEIGQVLRDPTPDRLDALAARAAGEAAERQDALDDVRRLIEPSVGAAGSHRRRGGPMTMLAAVARTEQGWGRDTNEDASLCRSHLLAVADGVGGLPSGEVASALAVALLDAAVPSPGSVGELAAVVRAANAAIADRARASSELGGMATTVCAVGVTPEGELAVVGVGDSRAYLLRDGDLLQLTEDHTVGAELVRRGGGGDDGGAADHPYRHVLTRVVGAGSPTVEVDGFVRRARPGDRLLLCTDGLVKVVSDAEIAAILADAAAGSDLGPVADALVGLARGRQAEDDVTVVVAELRAGS